jgi:hypothetical protein
MSPRRIRCDVTAANLPMISAPVRSWVEGLALAHGISAPVAEYSVYASRTNYYSAFPDGADWRDRWRLCWTFDIEFAADICGPDVSLRGIPLDYNVRDETWEFDDFDQGDRLDLILAHPVEQSGEVDLLMGELEERILAIAKLHDGEQQTSFADGFVLRRYSIAATPTPARARLLDEIVAEVRQRRVFVNWQQLWIGDQDA